MVACNTSTAVGIGAFRRRYDLPVLGVIRPGAQAAALSTRNRRVGVIATPATVRSHAYFDSIKDENPAIEVYEHATPTLVPMVEAGMLAGPEAEATVAAALAPLLGERDARRRVDLPAAARGVDRHAPARAARTTRSSGRSSRPPSGTASRSSTRRRRPRRRSPSCSSSTGSRRRARPAGTAADAGLAGHERPDEVPGAGRSAAGHDRRPGALPRPRRAAVRPGPAGRRDGRARDAGAMTDAIVLGLARPPVRRRPARAARGATTARGRRASSSGRRSGRPRPSSADGWSDRPARASSTGRPSNASPSAGCRPRRGR